MQFLSFIPRYFARRKVVADLHEQDRDKRLDGLRKVIGQMEARWDEAGIPPVRGKEVAGYGPVFDSDHDLQIMGILGVNAKAAWVLVADLPVQLTEHGHIKSRRLRFSSIIEFKPNDQGSGSFHCYGRLPDSKEPA